MLGFRKERRRNMRRSLVLLAGIVSTLILGATAAVAAPPVGATLQGSSDGVVGFCAGSAFTVSGSYSGNGALGNGTYSGTVTRLGGCGDIGIGFVSLGPSTPVTATFTFSGPGGSFTASGSGESLYSVGGAHVTFFPTTVTLTVADGTKRYKHAVGSLSLSVEAGYNGYDNSTWSSGTLTGSIG